MIEFYKTKELGEKIGKWLRVVQETALFNVGGKESRILKVKVEIDATKILKGKMKIVESDRKPMEIMLRYERLGIFCYYCAHIGHETQACLDFLGDTMKGVKRKEKIGSLIKADQ